MLRFLLLCLAFISGSSFSTQLIPVEEHRYELEIKKLKQSINEISVDDSLDKARLALVEQEAFNYGIENAVYLETKRINEKLELHSNLLNRAYNFGLFILDGNVLLPSIRRSGQVTEENEGSLRKIEASYTFITNAKVVTTPPTWRDFLFRQLPLPQELSAVAQPKNKMEQTAFERGLKSGYLAGIKQANEIFSSDWSNLDEIITGMYVYRKLVASGHLSLPKSKVDLSVRNLSGDGKTLYLNERIMSVTQPASFKPSENWEIFLKNGAK